MAKGGARARSGPAPDPNALRRDRDKADWMTLPAEGRQGPVPKWPLGDDVAAAKKNLEHLREMDKEEDKDVTSLIARAQLALFDAERRRDRELELWAGEWTRPQAIEWERNGQELEVALYVRSFVAAEDPKAATNARTLVKQQQEALGLSIPGLARNRWRIGDVPEPAKRQGGGVVGESVRDRFKVVTGGAA